MRFFKDDIAKADQKKYAKNYSGCKPKKTFAQRMEKTLFRNKEMFHCEDSYNVLYYK